MLTATRHGWQGVPEMKTPPNQTEFESAPYKANYTTSNKFSGTDNPRHLRAITALMTCPQPREHLDRAAGCSNAPELVAELRRRGLEIPCERIHYTDRDGKPTRPGIYHFNDTDRRKLNNWLRLRDAARGTA